MVADRVDADDGAFKRGDRALEERQAGRARLPRRTAEELAAGLDRRPGEAVGEDLLVLAEDVHGKPAGSVDLRGDVAPAVEGHHDQRRLERDGAEGVHRDPVRLAVLEGRDDGHPGHEVAHHLPEDVRVKADLDAHLPECTRVAPRDPSGAEGWVPRPGSVGRGSTSGYVDHP